MTHTAAEIRPLTPLQREMTSRLLTSTGSDWPLYPRLPMKRGRRGSNGHFEMQLGVIVDQHGRDRIFEVSLYDPIFPESTPFCSYNSVTEMMDAGWKVD